MQPIKTKSGLFVSQGILEETGLAIGFNIDNLEFKLKRMNDNWKNELRQLIPTLHTVLAQYDAGNASYPLRMLNAGGVIVLETEDNQPLAMLMMKEKSGLQLGFGKVELHDLKEELFEVQAKLDSQLRKILLFVLDQCESKEEFISCLHSNDLQQQFSSLLDILAENNSLITENLFALKTDLLAEELPCSFGRPPLNRFARKAAETAAIREIIEEVKIDANSSLDSTRLHCQQNINREQATDYMRKVIAGQVQDLSKFSAAEMNKDIESSSFVVTYFVSPQELEQMKASPSLQVVKPISVKINITNPEKGWLQTRLSDYPAIQGGGNQFTIALTCHEIFNIDAACTPLVELNPNTMFAPVNAAPRVPACDTPSLTS